ncbi:MAG: precorrin-6y C5,15-methyltransferase (decarboxylating) subunit CbiE, partial [Rhodospirillales bacterium]|nr:precorrin-6y C5,15-methyltransferase (decarboxylating) subunit CbiE [Rhodospirillales bacterium]
MIPWLAVIGIGEDGLDGLSPAARALVEQAEVLVGGQRHLTMIPDSVGAAERLVWGTPFPNGVARVLERRGRRTCVLASGDPMWFGIGSVLARNLPAEDMLIVPQAGAFSLAAARLGWAIHECAAVTVHGRPLELINLHLAENAKLLILSEDGRSPARVAELLRQAGYGPSRMVVFERLGGAHERCLEGLAAEWEADCHDLNTIAVECHAGAGTRGLSRLA